MYASHFGLKREPFSIAPDPRYLFMSERHREALAHLLYGVGGGGGFVLLTGEIGAGKTTVCRAFLEQIPRRCNVAYIFNPKLSVVELLQSVCDEFGIPSEHQGPGAPSVKDFVDPLNEYLLRTHAVGQNNVLIIDEAQNLSTDVLEQLRLLTNLETSERKLLQIMLIGQPELREMLAQPQLEQLAQRVIARFHLGALTETETAHYIQHRLTVAGRHHTSPFDRKALRRIHVLSRGVPRRINLLCDRALLGAYAGGRDRVDRKLVNQAALEVFDGAQVSGSPAPGMRLGPLPAKTWAWGLLGLCMVSGLLAVGRWASNRQLASGTSPSVALPASAVVPAHLPKTGSPDSTRAPVLADQSALMALALRNEKAAWQALAPAWKLNLGEGDPCSAAQGQQVQCFKGSGGLSLLRQLDRPSLLTLREGSSPPAYVVFTGLQGDQAVLLANGVRRAVPLAMLSRVWRGDIATFWRSPSGFRNKLQAGDRGPAVDWLAQQLAKIDGAPSQKDPNRSKGANGPTEQLILDAALQARVSAFQLAKGLKPDGVVGATTVMLINRASGVDEPRLTEEK
jgi:general secretion pathway protein A